MSGIFAYQSRYAICGIIKTHHYKRTVRSTIISDASLFAAAATLLQEGRVIAMWSRALTAAGVREHLKLVCKSLNFLIIPRPRSVPRDIDH